MQYEPTAPEILEAIAEFLKVDVEPLVHDDVVQFRLRVALNALGILGREFDQYEGTMARERDHLECLLSSSDSRSRNDGVVDLESSLIDLNLEFVELIRSGSAPAGTREHLLQVELARIAVASPKFLDRILPEFLSSGLEPNIAPDTHK